MKNEEYKKLSIDEFTKAAGRYESNHAGIYEMCKKDYPDILAELEKEPFRELLDAGCGPAPMISLLSEKYLDRHYTGLDLTPAMIEQAKKKDIPNATFVVGDCENFPFENDSFDAIICSMSLHHGRRQIMKEKVNVTGVPETMVQTLYARAKETRKKNAKIKDEIAVELVKKLDYDFSKADKDKAMTYGVIARTIVLDRMVKQYLEKHENTVVVNIACGLDTRCYRMKGKYLRWYNVDLPETMKIRRQFLPKQVRYIRLQSLQWMIPI